MNNESFSTKFKVRHLNESDIPNLLALCLSNPLYYEHCPPLPDEASIGSDMRALPPGRSPADKHYVGYFDSGELIAVMDLIHGYPHEKAAFIGFFMVDARRQGTGLGTQIISDLCAALRSLGYAEIRLGWVSTNPQSAHFWHKNGFHETGVSYATDGYTVTVASRTIS